MDKVSKIFGVCMVVFCLFSCSEFFEADAKVGKADVGKAKVTFGISSPSRSGVNANEIAGITPSRSAVNDSGITGITIDGDAVVPNALEAIFLGDNDSQFEYLSFWSTDLKSFDISVPAGKYDIVFLVGLDENAPFKYLLASGYLKNYTLVAGESNNIHITLKAIEAEITHPESITFGKPFSATIKADTKNPFIVNDVILPSIDYIPDSAVFARFRENSAKQQDGITYVKRNLGTTIEDRPALRATGGKINYVL